jgi:hypothetical protein
MLSLSSATASVGRWIPIARTDAPYNNVHSSVSITSEESAFYPTASSATLGAAREIRGITVTPGDVEHHEQRGRSGDDAVHR